MGNHDQGIHWWYYFWPMDLWTFKVTCDFESKDCSMKVYLLFSFRQGTPMYRSTNQFLFGAFSVCRSGDRPCNIAKGDMVTSISGWPGPHRELFTGDKWSGPHHSTYAHRCWFGDPCDPPEAPRERDFVSAHHQGSCTCKLEAEFAYLLDAGFIVNQHI